MVAWTSESRKLRHFHKRYLSVFIDTGAVVPVTSRYLQVRLNVNQMIVEIIRPAVAIAVKLRMYQGSEREREGRERERESREREKTREQREQGAQRSRKKGSEKVHRDKDTGRQEEEEEEESNQ